MAAKLNLATKLNGFASPKFGQGTAAATPDLHMSDLLHSASTRGEKEGLREELEAAARSRQTGEHPSRSLPASDQKLAVLLSELDRAWGSETPTYAQVRDIVLRSLHQEEAVNQAEDTPPAPTDPSYREWSAQRRRASKMLLEAAATSHLESLRSALGAGADYAATDDQGHTGLWLCSSRGWVEGVQILLAARADPDQQCTDGELPLVAAAIGDHAGVIKIIVESHGHVDVEDGDGASPLVMAASAQNHNAINQLLESGADPNFACTWDTNSCDNVGIGETALHTAARAAYPEAVAALLSHDADPSIRSVSGHSALHVCCGLHTRAALEGQGGWGAAAVIQQVKDSGELLRASKEEAKRAQKSVEAAAEAFRKESREEQEARERFEKEQAEAEAAMKLLTKEATEAKEAKDRYQKELSEAYHAQTQLIKARESLAAARMEQDQARISSLESVVNRLEERALRDTREAEEAELKFEKEKREQQEADILYQTELKEAKEAALLHCKEAMEADQARKHLESAVENAGVAERKVRHAAQVAQATALRVEKHKHEAIQQHHQWAERIFALSAHGSYGHHELNYDRYDRDGTGLINVDEFVSFCAFVDPTIDPATLKQSVMSGGARFLDVYALITLFIGDNVGKDEFVAWLAMYQGNLTPALRSTFMNLPA